MLTGYFDWKEYDQHDVMSYSFYGCTLARGLSTGLMASDQFERIDVTFDKGEVTFWRSAEDAQPYKRMRMVLALDEPRVEAPTVKQMTHEELAAIKAEQRRKQAQGRGQARKKVVKKKGGRK